MLDICPGPLDNAYLCVDVPWLYVFAGCAQSNCDFSKIQMDARFAYSGCLHPDGHLGANVRTY